MNQFVDKTWNFLHFFHRPFSRIMNQQQFRYLVCGGSLALFDVCTFICLNNYILHEHAVQVAGFSIKSYYFAAWSLFPVNLFLGFMSSKYIVFPGSHLPHGTQLFRYLMLVAICFFLNTALLNFFIGRIHLFPLMAKLSTTVIVATFSYLWQRFFSHDGHSMYGPHWILVGATVGSALVGIVLWGTIAGSMLPLILKKCMLDPATSSAPFVATLVDVTGLIIYFSIAMVIMRGTLL